MYIPLNSSTNQIRLAIIFITSIFCFSNVYSAQTLDEATNLQLGDKCAVLIGSDGDGLIGGVPPTFGPELTEICFQGPGANPPASPISAGGGSSTTQVASTILNRLRKDRSEDEEKEGAASSDVSFELMNGLDLFLSANYEVLDRDNTTFETGYDSDIWAVTAGVDVELTSWARGGLAFNYNHWDADFSGRGGFETDSYGPILFASFYPVDQFYADIVLNYVHKDYDRDRFAAFSDFGTVQASGDVSSDSDGDEFGAMLSSGYDFIFGRFTVGPRIGFQYSHLDIDGYTEKGKTGLELKYNDDTVESLKTTVGIRGSAAFSTQYGVLIPEINAEWVHEFMNDQRDIVVQFSQDHRANPTKFRYNNESPDRDYFNVGGGLSILLAHGIQPYVNFQALVGHDYYTNYIGTIGGRIEF